MPTVDPFEPKCECGYTWIVSVTILARGLACPRCFRYYYYQRNRKMRWKITKIGRYKSRDEMMKQTNEMGEAYGRNAKQYE